MTLNGNGDDANGYNSVIKNGALPDADLVKSVIPPIGTIMAWMKTFGSADSGTTDSTTANKLVQSGQNFTTTVDINMIVYNTTDSTYAYVTAVDDDTTLSLSADIMVSGEAYVIYKTPTLPDGWVECDGSVLSDSSSPYDGETLPDMNSTPSFLRGATSAGGTGGSDTHSHDLPLGQDGSGSGHITLSNAAGDQGTGNVNSTNRYAAVSGSNYGSTPQLKSESTSTLPVYVDVVWIMRVK